MKINTDDKIKAFTVLAFAFLQLFMFSGCKKDKLDNKIPLLDVSNKSGSAIRMFNFSNSPLDLTINNIPLTSYSNQTDAPGGTALGLSLFPTGVWPSSDGGAPFTIPNSLLDRNGKIIFRGLIKQVQAGTKNQIDTVIENNSLQPKDYYVLANGTVKVLNRENVPPVNPENFKIRIINLAQENDVLHLKGPVSLTYADGSGVNGKLNNVAMGQSSSFVEIPYGSYQFKLFVNSISGDIDPKKQLAELPLFPDFNPCDGASLPESQENLRVLVRTFKPGGVYSIVVTPSIFGYQCSGTFEPAKYITVNSYRVVTELDPGANTSYARMQALNAIPGKKISIEVDGRSLAQQLDYVGNTLSETAIQADYKTYVQGKHQITLKDEQGAVLTEATLDLYPYDNYTIWAYQDAGGKAALRFQPNNMTGLQYNNSPIISNVPDDGTDGSRKVFRFYYAWQSRFINLNPDLPSVSFTSDHDLFLPIGTGIGAVVGDTVRSLNAYTHLAPGQLTKGNATIIYGMRHYPRYAIVPVTSQLPDVGSPPRLIRAYESYKDGNGQWVIPGSLLPSVPALDGSRTFVANPGLYTPSKMPFTETGIYTVAMIGRKNTENAAHRSRLIAIKHNK